MKLKTLVLERGMNDLKKLGTQPALNIRNLQPHRGWIIKFV